MSILVFFIVLAVLILVHELGHFSAAKSAGIRVDEFGLGFPPRLVSIKPKKGETRYSLNILPFGGFVKIFGEDPTDPTLSGPDSHRGLIHKPRFVQVWVLVAGVLFNIIFAWFLISGGLLIGLPTSVVYGQSGLVGEPELTILDVLPDSPASIADLESGDVILFAESNNIALQGETLSVDGFQRLVADSGEEGMTLLIRRDEETFTAVATPSIGVDVAGERPTLGVFLDTIGLIKLPLHMAVWEGGKLTIGLLRVVSVGLGTFVLDAVTGNANLSDVAGPVGIVGLVGDASERGFTYLLSFTAFISLNLAVINLIPFPALDGGRILFVAIEGITRRAIKPNIAHVLNTVGFALLILLMVVVTYNDIVRLVAGSS